jgi:hypothetical protein
MMKSGLVPALLTLAMTCAVGLASAPAPQNTQDTQVKFPPGKWTLSHPPVTSLGLADAPLKITGVTGHVKNGGTITSVRLLNNSGKPVAAVKFAWFLYREQGPKKILQKGESPVLGVTGLPAGASKEVDYPVVSFGNIYKPLVKGGKLTGDFVLEVAVSGITYEDGSRWERK